MSQIYMCEAEQIVALAVVKLNEILKNMLNCSTRSLISPIYSTNMSQENRYHSYKISVYW